MGSDLTAGADAGGTHHAVGPRVTLFIWPLTSGNAIALGHLLLLLLQVRHMMFTWSLTNGIIDALADLEAAAAAALCHGPPASLAQRLLSWTRPLLPLLGAVHLGRNWAAVLGSALPAALRQGSGGEAGWLLFCWCSFAFVGAGWLPACCGRALKERLHTI